MPPDAHDVLTEFLTREGVAFPSVTAAQILNLLSGLPVEERMHWMGMEPYGTVDARGDGGYRPMVPVWAETDVARRKEAGN